MAGNQELRKELGRIVNSGTVAKSNHARDISNLSGNCANTIRCLEEAEKNLDLAYNCFQYAFALKGSQKILELLKEDAAHGCRLDLMFGTAFVERLISKGLLKLDPDGTVVVYFDEGSPKHAGRIEHGGRIDSKWGASGHRYSHDLWEIPERYEERCTYGNECAVFTPADPEDILQEFESYREELYEQWQGS